MKSEEKRWKAGALMTETPCTETRQAQRGGSNGDFHLNHAPPPLAGWLHGRCTTSRSTTWSRGVGCRWP